MSWVGDRDTFLLENVSGSDAIHHNRSYSENIINIRTIFNDLTALTYESKTVIGITGCTEPPLDISGSGDRILEQCSCVIDARKEYQIISILAAGCSEPGIGIGIYKDRNDPASFSVIKTAVYKIVVQRITKL